MAGSRLRIGLFGLVALLVLILLGHLNPLAYLFLGTWLPLPVMLVGWRLGTGAAVWLALAGAVLTFALNPGLAVFQDILGPGLPLLMGLSLTVCRRRGWQAGSAIICTVAGLGLVMLVWFLGQAYFQGVTPLALWGQKSREVTDTVARMLKDTGMGSSGLAVMEWSPVELQDLMAEVLPALMSINAGLVAWLNVLVARQLARWWGWGDLGDSLSRWASPEWLIFLFVSAGFALLAPLVWVRQAGLNLLLMLGFVYFCQGMAVIAALLQRFQVPWALRGLSYALAFLNPLMILVTILGLMDLWLDFRRLPPSRET